MSVSEFLSLVLFHFILSCIFFLGKSSFLPILALCVCACVCFPIFNFSSKTKKNCNRIHRIVFFSSLFPIKTSKWIIIIINIIIILKETKKNTPKNYYLKKTKIKTKEKIRKERGISILICFLFLLHSFSLHIHCD